MCCNAKKHAEKVTKKKLKITVKQWSVSFLVYRGRFAPLFNLFLIRQISEERKRVKTGKAKCNGLRGFSPRVKICINMIFYV